MVVVSGMDFSGGGSSSSAAPGLGGKSYSVHDTQHLGSGQDSPASQLGHQLAGASPASIKAEDAGVGNMTAASSPASALAGFGVSAAGVNLSVNIGVNITGVTPETAAAAAAPWATAAAYTSRYAKVLIGFR